MTSQGMLANPPGGIGTKAEPVVKAEDPRGRPIYRGPAGAEQDAGPGTDFTVRNGFVSVTRYRSISPDTRHWNRWRHGWSVK